MYEVIFYRDEKGHVPVEKYLIELAEKGDKDSRIKFNKIQEYIELLTEYGTRAGEKVVKHIEGKIYELRPLKDRILFCVYVNGVFVLLHPFRKTTRKTPKSEIEKAKREYEDLMRRGID